MRYLQRALEASQSFLDRLTSIQLPEASSDSYMDNDSDARRFGYLVVGALVLVVGVMGSAVPIESAAIGPGIVQVEGKRKSIQHLEGGIISEVLVSNGDVVIAEEPLMKLDATTTSAELQIIEGRRYNLLAQSDRLTSERDDRETVVFTQSLVAASETDERAANAMLGEVAIFESRFAGRKGEENVLEKKIMQLAQKKSGLQAIHQAKSSIVTSLDEEMEDLAELLVDGYVDKQRLRELERSRITVLGDISELEAQIAASEVAIAETELQILQLTALFKAEVVSELRLVQQSLHDMRQQESAAAFKVARSTIRSPVAGVVMGLQRTTVGGVVGAGEQLMEIVPESNDFIIEVRLSPMDIDRVKVGQPAEIRFSVFKDAYLVSGHLTKVSADRLTDASTDIPYYAAEVTPLQEDLKLLNGMALVPGMPAEVLIKTGERTMLSYLTSPLNRMFSRSLTED